MTDGSGSTTWTYFTNGWLKTEQRTIAGKANTLSYTYNGDGTVATIAYPSGNVITYGIGSDERSTTATDVTHNLNYVATASYMPPGELSSMIFGQATGFSGITDTAGFNSRLFFTGAKASTSSATAQNVSLSYNNNGTVSSIQNGVTSGLSESFTYDSLDRILSAATSATSGAGCWGQSFGPSGNPPAGPPDDRWSNLTEVNVTQCTASALSVTASSATNQVTTAGYGYDVVGNMTADGRTGYAYTFDAENHMTQASGTPSGTWTYTYDGNGLRVEKTNGTTGTLYWRNLAGNTIAETDLTGSTTDSAYREYIFFAGQRVAQRDATTPTPNVYFYYSDQVGSTTAISTAAGVSCYQATFTPYGQEMATQTTCSSNYKFTGYERDAETGFDYAFARYYNSTLGRFMSPDPLAGDVNDPQTLNRYAYVENSPTNFADPSGMIKCAYQKGTIPGAGDISCLGEDGDSDAWSGSIGWLNFQIWNPDLYPCDNGLCVSALLENGYGTGGWQSLNWLIQYDSGNVPNFGHLIGQTIVALTNPNCAALFGGFSNAVSALASSTYNTYSPGEANPYPNQIQAADWTNRTSSVASDQYGFTFWSTASPGGNLFFTSNFGNYAPGFPSSPDGFGQMTGFLHEFEHAANHSNALDLAIDASPGSYAADAVKININCAPKEIETTSSPIATSLTPP